jgi:hypothetical protein
MRAAARLRALERRRSAKGSESEILIRVVAWLDESERPGLAMSSERRRRVDYRADLHLIAPEGYEPSG